MPAVVHKAGIAGLQLVYQLVYLVLDKVRVDHGVFRVVLVLMPRAGAFGDGFLLPAVVVYKGHVRGLIHMVGRRVHEYVKAGLSPGGDRYHRDAQHLRQPVGVDLHAPLFNYVHHVQGQYHWLAKLYEL